MPSTTVAVPVPGGQLHAVAEGAGPPIVLLHAWVADLRAWDPVVPLPVDAGYRAVRFDARRVVIPDVAHMVGMEAPGQLAGLILDHVRPLGTWA